jgi:hypothetical protein
LLKKGVAGRPRQYHQRRMEELCWGSGGRFLIQHIRII